MIASTKAEVRKMTLEEIAKLAGVSKTTASYVINGKAEHYRISKATQKKVAAVVKAHNYRPNYTASALRMGNSRCFGLIIPDLENLSHARLAKRLEQQARQAGYQIFIACSDDDPETEQSLATSFVSRRIDVLFVASVLPNASAFYWDIQQTGIPVIALDRPLDDTQFACVISEDQQAAFRLTQSVITPDMTCVGLLGALPELSISQRRQLGVEQALAAQGIALQLSYADHFSPKEGQRLFNQWLMQDSLPNAIIITSYTLLEGVLDVLSTQPQLMQQVNLATFGDHRLLDFLPIAIQSMPQQFDLIAQQALELALNATQKRYQTGTWHIERQLIVRGKN